MPSKKSAKSANLQQNNDHGLPSNGFGFAVATLSVFCCLSAIAIWPRQAAVFNQEGGPIETLSAGCLLLAGLVALVKFQGFKRLYIGLICLLLSERELEAEIYLDGTLFHSVLSGLDDVLDIALVRVALLVTICAGLLLHGTPVALLAMKQRTPSFFVFLGAGMCALVAQILEEISSAFDDVMHPLMVMRLFVLEETLEMFFAAGILAAVLIGWPKSKSEGVSNGTGDTEKSG